MQIQIGLNTDKKQIQYAANMKNNKKNKLGGLWWYISKTDWEGKSGAARQRKTYQNRFLQSSLLYSNVFECLLKLVRDGFRSEVAENTQLFITELVWNL